MNVSRKKVFHGGGIWTIVVMKEFHSRRCTNLVKELLQEQRVTLGVSQVGVTKRNMQERVEKYDMQEFWSETTVTQAVAVEWCVAEHLHKIDLKVLIPIHSVWRWN